MPGYEASLILRIMRKPELVDTLKRSLTEVMTHGGIVRRIENLGERQLPYRMRAHRQNFSHGQYFLVEFDGPPTIVQPVMEYLHRDIDIVRPSILRRDTESIEDGEPCEGPYDERYNPDVKNLKKLKLDVQEELKKANIKV